MFDTDEKRPRWWGKLATSHGSRGRKKQVAAGYGRRQRAKCGLEACSVPDVEHELGFTVLTGLYRIIDVLSTNSAGGARPRKGGDAGESRHSKARQG